MDNGDILADPVTIRFTKSDGSVVVEGDLLEDEARAGSVISAIYVTAVAHAPRGAWPLGFLDRYEADEQVIARYASIARTAEGFSQFLDRWLEAREAA